MIFDLILGLIEGIVTNALAPLPTHELGWTDNLGPLMSNLASLNYFLPIAETFAVVVGIMALFPIFFGVNFALFCIAFLRGASSRG